MWITCEKESTVRLYNDEVMDEPVEFNASGTAQVPDTVGEAMVDHYDCIRPTEANKTDA